MNDGSSHLSTADAVRARTRFESVAIGLRLARSIAARFDLSDAGSQCPPAIATASFPNATLAVPESREALSAALRFAFDLAAGFGVRPDNEGQWRAEIRALRDDGSPHPLSRVTKAAAAGHRNELIADLVVLSGLPEFHEAFATLCKLLHPQAKPYPTVALALHWLEYEAERRRDAMVDTQATLRHSFAVRERVEELLLHSTLAEIGLVRLEGEGPWHQRTLRSGPGVWDALNARAPRLPAAELVAGYRSVPGLDSWLEQPNVQRATRALRAGEPCLIALLGPTDAMRSMRVRALLGAAGMGAVHTRLHGDLPVEACRAAAADAYCAAFMHGALPWFDVTTDAADSTRDSPVCLPRDASLDMPALVSASAERALPQFDGPILALRIEPLPAAARRRMWNELLPQLAGAAGVLAARYPIEPDEARGVVCDLSLLQRTAENPEQPLMLDEIGACLRSRTAWRGRPGVRRVIPRAEWSSLVIPTHAASQLTEAVLRIHQQLTVLDDWGFEQGRNDRRGLRLLFYGPPGTGKTLAAEAMARALGVDLLAVDIASLVSKWIGETEKNLAAVFELAESSRALLLFDEADALFGRRTDASDANDRYANLETAFLLQRLERYEGVAILATNLRASLDAAFTRRFEFIVEFPEPDLATRRRLWGLHVPPGAPLDADVDFGELAHWYALSGAQIRNAALGAAFLAAADGDGEARTLRQTHFLQAIEREFEKAGKAHPGSPPARAAARRQPVQEPVDADESSSAAHPQ